MSVRTEAKNIGMQAIKAAAAERQREEQLVAERRSLMARLDSIPSLAEAALIIATSIKSSETCLS